MLIKRKRGWEIPEREATPKAVALNRRQVLAAAGVAGGVGLVSSRPAHALFGFGEKPEVLGPVPDNPSEKFYPFPENGTYTLGRPVTPKDANFVYNNFYEFRPGSAGDCAAAARALPIWPWQVTVDGLVEEPFTIGVDELMAKMPLEQRLYRHRCVEAWAMAVPWDGFALADFVKLAKPLGSAKYLRFETFYDPSVAPAQKIPAYPWPYSEGVTIAEAMNDLAFLVTGCYDAPLPNQMGAPLRLALPWKYGFKSIKSIVKVTFTEDRPVGLWEAIQGREYGFWANVNPAVPHPRWSQAFERLLGTDERVPTQIYNGYGEYVADLYAGMENERLFM